MKLATPVQENVQNITCCLLSLISSKRAIQNHVDDAACNQDEIRHYIQYGFRPGNKLLQMKQALHDHVKRQAPAIS